MATEWLHVETHKNGAINSLPNSEMNKKNRCSMQKIKQPTQINLEHIQM